MIVIGGTPAHVRHYEQKARAESAAETRNSGLSELRPLDCAVTVIVPTVEEIEVHGGRPDAPVIVRCNPAMAEQALANLVHNAVAHGEPGGHVAVLLASEAGRFTLTVVDDGPGVAPVDLPRLGERTFRGDEARRRDPRGSGLGLAISGEVCRRAGWTLGLTAELPRGLRATITGPTLAT